jgi:FkbM family methyltransferase
VDGGAYRGAYGSELRASGFGGKIISYEPQSDAFGSLAERCRADENWRCERLALGDRDGTDEMYLSQEGPTNSLLVVESDYTDHNPDAVPTRTEEVSVRRLDSIAGHRGLEGRLYVKLDVQGFELNALRGAEGCLDRIVAVEIELSLTPVYQGQPLVVEVVKYLDLKGFSTVRTLDPHLWHPAGALVQVDGIFTRSE